MDSPAFAFRFKLEIGDLVRAYALSRQKSAPLYVGVALILFVGAVALFSYMDGGVPEVGRTLAILFSSDQEFADVKALVRDRLAET